MQNSFAALRDSLPLPPAVRTPFVNALQQGSLELPLLPDVAREVLLITTEEDCDPRRLADLIRRDASMAGNLMQIANSALYRPSVPIVSLQQAISRLGLLAIRQIAMIITCKTRIFHVPGYEQTVRALFEHSLATALVAQELARQKRLNVEEAFLAGLLHDIGRPVALQTLVDLGHQTHTPLPAAVVTASLDQCHPALGALLVQRWDLPVALAEAIGHHHDPLAAGAAPLLALLMLSDELAHLLLRRGDSDDEHQAAVRRCQEHPALRILNLYYAEVEALLKQGPQIADRVKVMM